MSNGTERDEPGQRSGDGSASPTSSTSDGPSSDPVWPVWGGAGSTPPEPEVPTDLDPADAEGVDDGPDVAEGTEAAVVDAEPESAADEDVDPAADGAELLDHDASAAAADADDPADVPVVEGADSADDAVDETVVDDAAPTGGAEAAAAEDPADVAVVDETADNAASAPADEVDEPATAEPVAANERVADVAAEPEAGDTDEPAADADADADGEPGAGDADEPAADGAGGPVAGDADEPGADVVAEPVASDVDEPADEIAEPAGSDSDESADEPEGEDADEVAEPVADAADEPGEGETEAAEVGAGIAEVPADDSAAPAADDAAEPVAEDVAEPTVDDATEPAGDAVSEPVDAPVDAAVASAAPATESADVAAAPVEPAVEQEPALAETVDTTAEETTEPTDDTAEPAPTAPSPAADDASDGAQDAAATTATAAPDDRVSSSRDDATAVIAPVAAATAATAAAPTTAAPTTPVATTPQPIGTLAAPVTRTLPPTAPATAATPTGSASTAPVTAAAAAVAAAAAPTTPVAAAAPPAPPLAPPTPAPKSTTAPTPASAPIPSGPVPPSPSSSNAGAPAAVAAAAGATAAGATAASNGPIPSGPVPPSARKESPLDVFEAEDGKRRWPRRLLIVLGVLVVLAAAYVGASYALADRVPRGATVAGVDIGGLPADEAVARLDTELADATTQPIEVVANDVQATIDPVAAGLTFDAQATVDQLTGVNLAEPKRLWQHIVGVGEQEPVTSVDDTALSAALGDLGTSLALAPVDGTIVFVDATAQSTAAVDGWDLDQDAAADVLSEQWLTGERPIDLPTVPVAPDITQEETDAALVEAQKVTSAPVSVEVTGQIAMLDTATLAANAAYVPTDGNLVLQMNGEGLSAVVLAQLPNLLTASADAHFEFVNDAPVIVPGTPGTSLDPAALATAVGTAATSSDRTAHVELIQADPSQSTAELEALGVKEIVSEFSTPLTSEPRRTVNITNGASKISGTLIRPGETFSLTDALGPIDAAHGFVEAGAIVSGEHTDAWGGGLSQISTTTYNAAFLAGFEDIEHRPHSEWFARYPEGREATIFTGTLDMRWKNNTPYGALVQAWVDGGRVYVRVWGTKYWTVESITSPRSGVVAPTTVYSQSPTCEASSAGNPGFSVTVTRKTSLNGELVKTESNSWRYKPQNKIICGPAPTPGATP